MPWSRHVMILLTMVNGLVAIQTINTLAVQMALGVSYPPLLRAVTSALWMIAFAWLTVGLFRRSARVLRFVAPLLTIYGLWTMVSLLTFARAEFDQGRALFQGIFTLIALIPFWWWHFRVASRTSAAKPG